MQGHIPGMAKALNPQQTPCLGSLGFAWGALGPAGCSPGELRIPGWTPGPGCVPEPFPVCSECLKIPLKPGLVPELGLDPAQGSLSCTRGSSQLGEEGLGWEFSSGCVWNLQAWFIQPQRVPWVLPQTPNWVSSAQLDQTQHPSDRWARVLLLLPRL